MLSGPLFLRQNQGGEGGNATGGNISVAMQWRGNLRKVCHPADLLTQQKVLQIDQTGLNMYMTG